MCFVLLSVAKIQIDFVACVNNVAFKQHTVKHGLDSDDWSR